MKKITLVRADYYTKTNKYVVFVGGYAINSKESFPEVANSIARQAGQTTYEETVYGDGPAKTSTIEVY